MTTKNFDDKCAGCRPAMMEVKDGRATLMPDDAPAMKIINKLWGETTLEERKAWHRFTCQNSRDPDVLELVQAFTGRIDAALAGAAETN